MYEDNFMRREILSLVVQCTYVELGCTWKGEVRHLEVWSSVVLLLLLLFLFFCRTENCVGPNLRRKSADVINVVYFRRSLTCTLWLTNDLIDGGQPRAKPHLRKVKLNHVL